MSENVAAARRGPIVVAQGEWAGWSTWQTDAFEQRAGPFYEREEDGGWTCAFRAEARHLNGGDTVHGGCLMTFADMALFTIARAAMEGDRGVTVNLSGDFLGAGLAGDLIEARGHVTRAGRGLVFVQGLASVGTRPVLSFTGIIKRLKRT